MSHWERGGFGGLAHWQGCKTNDGFSVTVYHRSGAHRSKSFWSHSFNGGGLELFSHYASDVSGTTRVFSCVCARAASPHAVILHFQMPRHNSTWMCSSRLSSAPAGETKFLKHRKHPAENILIKQTPHKILFWGGKKPSPQSICQRRVGRHEKTNRQAGARSSWASAMDGSVWAHGSVPGPFIRPGFS